MTAVGRRDDGHRLSPSTRGDGVSAVCNPFSSSLDTFMFWHFCQSVFLLLLLFMLPPQTSLNNQMTRRKIPEAYVNLIPACRPFLYISSIGGCTDTDLSTRASCCLQVSSGINGSKVEASHTEQSASEQQILSESTTLIHR